MGTDNMSEYGEKFKEHLLKQYELYLIAADKISDRRASANKYFYTLNSGILVSISFLLNSNIQPVLIIPAILLLTILGIIFSIIFWYLINSYKQLNTGKFKVVHKMEEQLPMQPYKDEWIELGEGKNKSKYYPFSQIEKIIPIIFGAIYSILTLSLVVYLGIKTFCV